ncbi:hypothetical protein NB693_24685 [Pantoea ananatis]|nr:hypothetical protein [Pantoea ananatis]
MERLQKQGPNGGFRSAEEMQRVAGQVAFEAKVSGITRIDDLVPSKDGKGLIAVERNENNPHDVNRAGRPCLRWTARIAPRTMPADDLADNDP